MAENIINVDQDSFQKAVLDSQKPVLVDFWAPWCGPCRAVAPVIEELAKDYKGKMEFAKVNVDESPFVASKFGVMSIPTIIVFKGGKPVHQAIGYQPKDQLKKLLDNALAK
ncbi:MAG: thioredoxin [Chloroflexi bacterium RBG_13_48_17]|nr:MAG: thioredoxin [Chloroflexi bacterium RBG_13_48_17]